ncbi:hypothetical protein B0T19DRAFT_415984 [Cercophora scortea]|uniref:NB-ARC domain-containing protein n=1 Tax=Cercophora scortea TaxID=314031 RepID=A0AAE0IWG7_9PEZI|nr:hypothetical protein B0T19DRAFT_415984 [Cercophora scortea]
MAPKLGLRRVVPVGDVDSADHRNLDIIAIHGLGTESPRTWEYKLRGEDGKVVNWLADADMLPAVIPEASIYTYDWNANYFEDAPVQSILGHAHSLLVLISDLQGSNHRPIIFIASCFGGLILAEALTRAAQQGSEYRHILQSTVGITFLGTPFSGSDASQQAQWQVIVGGIMGEQTSNQLVDALNTSDRELRKLTQQFAELAGRDSDRIPICCFYETKETEMLRKVISARYVTKFSLVSKQLKTRKLLVTESSACLQSFERRGLDSTHSGLNKFDSPDSANFKLVKHAIRRFADNASLVIMRRSGVESSSSAALLMSYTNNPEYVLSTRTVSSSALTAPLPSTSTPAVDDTSAARQRIVLVPYPGNPDFVGRTDILDRLKDHLGHLQSETATKIKRQSRVAVYGLGGVGKTQIALEYIHWLKESSSDVSIFWVHASTTERFRESYASIAQECHIPGIESAEDVLPLVKAWLESEEQGRWLLVIDNADDAQLFFSPNDAEQAGHEGNLARYIPDCTHGAILVTTKNKEAGLKLTRGKHLIEVGKMNQDEAELLLRTRLDESDFDPGELSTLSSRLEHLPLALAQAAAFIQENSMLVSAYIELLDSSDQDLVGLLSEEVETAGGDSGTPRALAETWILSFELVEDQDALAGELLSLIAFVDRQAIPLELLTKYMEAQIYDPAARAHKAYGVFKKAFHEEEASSASKKDKSAWGILKPQKALSAAKSVYRAVEVWDPTAKGVKRSEAKISIELHKAIGLLKAFSFVTQSKSGSLDMHRLVQLVTRKWLIKKRRAQRFASEALVAMSRIYPHATFENRAKCSAYLPHALAVLKHNNLDGLGTGASRLEKLARADILDLVALYLQYLGQYAEAEKLHRETVALLQEVLGDKHRSTLDATCKLTGALRMQRKYAEAEELGQQALATARKVFGDDDTATTMVCMTDLATIYGDSGQSEKALALQMTEVEMKKRAWGEEHHGTLVSISNMCMNLFRMGQQAEAERRQRANLETELRVMGAENPIAQLAMANLAYMLEEQGRFDEAVAVMEVCLPLSEKSLSANHPQLASNRFTMARVSAKAKLARAREAEAKGEKEVEGGTEESGETKEETKEEGKKGEIKEKGVEEVTGEDVQAEQEAEVNSATASA